MSTNSDPASSPTLQGEPPWHILILLHRNLWMGCYASIEQVLGPPFDKMSHTVTARQVCQIQSPTTESTKRVLTRRSEFELDWQMSRRVMLLPVLTQTHP